MAIAIAGVVLGVSVAVYAEMLALGAAIIGVCLLAAAMVYYFSEPPHSLTNVDANIDLQNKTTQPPLYIG